MRLFNTGLPDDYRKCKCVVVGVATYSREAFALTKQANKKKRFCHIAKSQL